jgi:hypothetical protein
VVYQDASILFALSVACQCCSAAVLAVYTAVTWRMCMESRVILCSFTGLFNMAAARADGSCLLLEQAGYWI